MNGITSAHKTAAAQAIVSINAYINASDEDVRNTHVAALIGQIPAAGFDRNAFFDIIGALTMTAATIDTLTKIIES